MLLELNNMYAAKSYRQENRLSDSIENAQRGDPERLLCLTDIKLTFKKKKCKIRLGPKLKSIFVQETNPCWRMKQLPSFLHVIQAVVCLWCYFTPAM